MKPETKPNMLSLRHSDRTAQQLAVLAAHYQINQTDAIIRAIEEAAARLTFSAHRGERLIVHQETIGQADTICEAAWTVLDCNPNEIDLQHGDELLAIYRPEAGE
jgi:hypothetical protein